MIVETIHAERVGDVTVIGFGATTLYHEDGVELARILWQTKTARIVINLNGVAHCTSATFNALIQRRRILQRIRGGIHLCLLSDELREKLRMLKLEDTVFPVYDSQAAAIVAFASSPPTVPVSGGPTAAE